MKTIHYAAIMALTVTACGPGQSKESAAIEAATLAVTTQLRDPTSPIFSDVTVLNSSVCGYVNAKNGFGGYSGKIRFLRLGETPARLEPERTSGVENDVAAKIGWCGFDIDFRECKGEPNLPDTMTCLPSGIRDFIR